MIWTGFTYWLRSIFLAQNIKLHLKQSVFLETSCASLNCSGSTFKINVFVGWGDSLLDIIYAQDPYPTSKTCKGISQKPSSLTSRWWRCVWETDKETFYWLQSCSLTWLTMALWNSHSPEFSVQLIIPGLIIFVFMAAAMAGNAVVVMRLLASAYTVAEKAGAIVRKVLHSGELGIVEKVSFRLRPHSRFLCGVQLICALLQHYF